MKTYPNGIPLATFFLFASAEHLVFALPALVIILLLQLLDLKAALLIFTIFILADPIASWMTWMIAKGSNWANTAAAMKTAGAISGQLYGALVGGLFGARFFGMVGLLLMTALNASILFTLGKAGLRITELS